MVLCASDCARKNMLFTRMGVKQCTPSPSDLSMPADLADMRCDRAQGRRGALLSRGATIARRRFEPYRARGSGGHAGGAARAACCISLLPLLPGTPDGHMFVRSGRRRPRGTRSARGSQRPTDPTLVQYVGLAGALRGARRQLRTYMVHGCPFACLPVCLPVCQASLGQS